MTLREFIEQEIENGNVCDIEEFYTKLRSFEWEDGEEIPHEEFEDYLDYNLDSAAVWTAPRWCGSWARSAPGWAP